MLVGLHRWFACRFVINRAVFGQNCLACGAPAAFFGSSGCQQAGFASGFGFGAGYWLASSRFGLVRVAASVFSASFVRQHRFCVALAFLGLAGLARSGAAGRLKAWFVTPAVRVCHLGRFSSSCFRVPGWSSMSAPFARLCAIISSGFAGLSHLASRV